jgi:hypothetical protein
VVSLRTRERWRIVAPPGAVVARDAVRLDWQLPPIERTEALVYLLADFGGWHVVTNPSMPGCLCKRWRDFDSLATGIVLTVRAPQ